MKVERLPNQALFDTWYRSGTQFHHVALNDLWVENWIKKLINVRWLRLPPLCYGLQKSSTYKVLKVLKVNDKNAGLIWLVRSKLAGETPVVIVLTNQLPLFWSSNSHNFYVIFVTSWLQVTSCDFKHLQHVRVFIV